MNTKVYAIVMAIFILINYGLCALNAFAYTHGGNGYNLVATIVSAICGSFLLVLTILTIWAHRI